MTSTSVLTRGLRLIAVLVSAAAVAGCGWRGLNSIPLPGTEGGGPGSYTIRAQMPDVENLQQNSRVRVGDVTVGNVTKIERQGWNALVTMTLNGEVQLPANATATIGQTSLLGSLHIELAPPTDVPSEGSLRDGSLIPIDRSGKYPSTEQTLAAVSMLLNGGGIGQIQDITRELNVAFAGRADDLRNMLVQLDTFTANLDQQSDDIITATASINRLAAQFAQHDDTVRNALTTIPAAITVLKDQRANLAQSIDLLGKFSALASDSVHQTKESLVAELKALAPVLHSLADAGPALTRSLSMIATYPWPNETIEKTFRGDYSNMTAIIDLTLSRLDAAWFTGTRFEGNLTELEMQWGRTWAPLTPWAGTARSGCRFLK